MNKIAVVLFNLGGPDSLDAVQPFLENLFNDPDIFKVPFQKSLAKFISEKRAPKVQNEYKLIGGSSPINMWTEKQRLMLQTDLLKNNFDAEVFVAMRYWKPLTSETAKILAAKKFDKIILLPLYPHFSISTTGSSFNEWKRVYGGEASNLIYINSYPTNKYYLRAINQKIDESLLNFPEGERENVQLVFSAHGTPVSYVKKGDPYSRQIKETMEAVMKLRNHSHDYHLCFQSKVGPAKWLEPSTSDKIKELSLKGKKHLLVIPISFVSDHVETAFELNIEYRHVADECGIENYFVMNGLNDSDLFISALSDLVKLSLQ